MVTSSKKTKAQKGGSKKSRKGGSAQSTGGEFRSGPAAGTALISGVTFAQKGVVYAEIEGQAIFEGDIVLGSVDELQAADAGEVVESIGITGQQFRWPNGKIPYDIEASMPNKQRITDAIAHWEAKTAIRFVLRTAANAAQYPDYMHFKSGSGCSSQVGRRGGRQDVTLSNSCSKGNAIHEIGHTVGLWHEQSREDRNTFVKIVFANIDPSTQHNFLQHITDGDDLGPYDYGSIMHYPPDAFSINGQATIIALKPLPPGVVMGQRTSLSQGDINGVKQMYPNIGGTIKEVPKDPITDTIKEVHKDPIQDTVKEIIRETIKEVGRDPLGGGGNTLVETINLPGQIGRQPSFDPNTGASPFVTATPSRVGGGPADILAEATSNVQQLAEALVMLQQQQAELLQAYDQAVQSLDALQQGQ